MLSTVSEGTEKDFPDGSWVSVDTRATALVHEVSQELKTGTHDLDKRRAIVCY